MNFLAFPFLVNLVDSTAELPCMVHYHPYGVYDAFITHVLK
jgi:hypothetical protein